MSQSQSHKKRVAIFFGGKSSEHEVSIRSARNVTDALDKNKFEAVLIAISQEGTFYHCQDNSVFSNVKITDALASQLKNHASSSLKPIAVISENNRPVIFHLDSGKREPIDVAFPVMHGTYGEDGCIQGFFKMINTPFVGCGIYASAAGMDKEAMKKVLKDADIPCARYLTVTRWNNLSYDEIAKQLGPVFFIKPASQGSSVGVHKIKSKEDYTVKMADALLYDHKVLAEEFIQGREIEVSVMGLNHAPRASVPGEIIPHHEFYSYEAKYMDDNGASLEIPAKVSTKEISLLQDLAKKTYTAMGCDGLTRVDFFLTQDGRALLNEINTIPGFTKISMYPKMWEATGVSYQDLITQLLELAFEKFKLDNSLKTNFL